MSQKGPKNEDFQTREYWDSRYEKEDGDFDWFKKYDEIRDIFLELIPSKQSRVLMLGCGNSTLSADMYADGYSNITNIDYSPVVIDKMRARHPEMAWHVMDIRELKENSAALGGLGTWDVIIDKGTMDALMAEKGSVWDPSPTVLKNVALEVDGVVELLKPKSGVFIYLTFAQKHFRQPHLERPGLWEIETRTLGDMFHYYLFICRR
ncbi:S-adenosyl-L-methionine-dependent methyltransferase [Violaceomyces palustris]|uniref:S-adenosyl-L-methionine-dependent methyltransferase n=1 Tax=Violaceomyces palustris TaxID=1673888 RepID=A0ACD0NUJ9_9BASI|nr:S-adenosyl-L-methionine-dependent methyltransferase [Violaceomyces palustris]